MVAQHLKQRYGDAVTVDYFDLANSAVRERFPEVARMIDAKEVPVPVVAIDGEVKMAGAVDFWHIADIIDAKGKHPPSQAAS